MADSPPPGSSLSRELSEIDEQLEEIEVQLVELKQRKRNLLEKRDQLNRVVERRAKGRSGSEVKWESENFPWSTDLRTALVNKFKMKEFRELQLAVINSCLSGEDAVVIMPTGGGKSLCYQLPAQISEGITLVVSPLVSLMEDQVMALQNLSIEAVMLDKNCPKERLKAVQKTMVDTSDRKLKLIYVTPEKVAKSKLFMAKLEKCYELGRLTLIAVDEVHCCSQWGHDFRRDYQFLNMLKRQFPRTPLLGLTATAGSRVVDDVKNMLSIPAALVFRASFNRANLFYEVRNKPADQTVFLDDICDMIKGRFAGQSGIIYCFSKKESEELTQGLRKAGIEAAFYHADVEADRRSEVHRKWASNRYQVIVATVAFGMGIDKPDVRFVIHHSLPKSMDNYYQESGRAGRDDQPAVCVLYYRYGDIFRQSTMVCTEKKGVENLYAMVAYCLAPADECRRAVIARNFAEAYDRSWCAAMCDNCVRKKAGRPSERVDIADHCRKLVALIGESERKLTPLMLVDLFTKGKKNSIGRDTAERIIVSLLLEGYLKEDFHFTSFSIISYITSGARAAFLQRDDVIFADMSCGANDSELITEPVPKKAKKSSS